MGLFSRKEKNPIIGFEVQFEKNGRVYHYQQDEKSFISWWNDRVTIRGNEHRSIVAIRRSGERQPCDFPGAGRA